MSISKDEWQDIENKISHPYGSVKLKCDGYGVCAIVGIGKNEFLNIKKRLAK